MVAVAHFAGKAEFDRLRSEARRTHPALCGKIEAARGVASVG
jgi:hypothetical protein